MTRLEKIGERVFCYFMVLFIPFFIIMLVLSVLLSLYGIARYGFW